MALEAVMVKGCARGPATVIDGILNHDHLAFKSIKVVRPHVHERMVLTLRINRPPVYGPRMDGPVFKFALEMVAGPEALGDVLTIADKYLVARDDTIEELGEPIGARYRHKYFADDIVNGQ